MCIRDSIGTTVPNHVHDIHADTFAHQSVAAFGVDYCTLLVHHVVIFQQTLTAVSYTHLVSVYVPEMCFLAPDGKTIIPHYFDLSRSSSLLEAYPGKPFYTCLLYTSI